LTNPPDRPLLEALEALTRALDELGAPAMIIGGIAVIARGVPRLTTDIDATVWGAAVSQEALFRGLEAHGIVGRIPSAGEFARQRQVLLLRHTPTGTPIEVSVGWLPFEKEALERASPLDFGGVRISVAQAEDLVVYKAVAWRDRDREDIERLFLLHGPKMNLERLRSLVAQFSEALDEPERVPVFEEMLRRAGLLS
jgi:hypothetical protein